MSPSAPTSRTADLAAYASRVIHFREGRIVRDERVAAPYDAAAEVAAAA